MALTRKEVLANLKKEIDAGRIILGAGAGTGISAKSGEAGGVDLFIIYNSGRYRMAGRGSLAGILSYGDANQIVVEMGHEVLSVVKKTPVLAGVCGTDPFRTMDVFLKQLKDQGFVGVQNFPTVGLIDGVFRANLEETDMGYGLEVEMIRKAHEMDLLTSPYVFNPEQAKQMAAAGADILVAHMGLTTKGAIGAKTALSLDDCVKRVQEICDAGKSVNPEIMVLCHGGPIAEPDDAHYVLSRTKGVDGFFGASSIERFATEVGIKQQAQAFKRIDKSSVEKPGKRFVTVDDVETQVFDWGTLSWLSEPRVTCTDNMATGFVEVQPGGGHARHNHPGCEEVLYILEGEAKQTYEENGKVYERIMKKGDLAHLPADMFHSTLNVGSTALKFLAVYQFAGPEEGLRNSPDCKLIPPKNK